MTTTTPTTTDNRRRTPRRTTTSPRTAPTTPALTASGTFRAHVRGFGFVDLTNSLQPGSAFVPPPLTAGLLDGDTVTVGYHRDADERATVATISRTARSRTSVFGVVEHTATGRLLRLDPHLGTGRWQLAGDTPAGHAARADITGDRTATVTGTWADPTSADAIAERIRVRHQIADSYPPEVLAEPGTGQLHTTGPVSRRDLRELTTFTIDAPSSRDLDDALSVWPADPDGGLRVAVHIADVAAHVPVGSALDVEARRAGTSVYLPGWTRPMLPPELSEDALSLLPGADRDALTVEMRLASDGTVTAADVYATRIRSDLRLSYETAAEILAGAAPQDVPGEVVDALRWLRTAAARLGVQRARRGGVDARRVEPELTVRVAAGRAEQAIATPANPANLLIERLMVAANEAVADWLARRGLAAPFRAHPAPAAEAAPALEAFCAAAGFHPGFGRTLTPLDLAALSAQLDATAGETAAAVWSVLLGYLGRAQYQPAPGLHFGLASPAYLHFTSPIRRYADLVVHRVVHTFLAGERDTTAFPSVADLDVLTAHLNTVTGTASRAEAQMRKALWLVTLAEQATADPSLTWTARVSGVNRKGVFVTLDDSLVSGFVGSRDLAGHGWEPTPDGLALVTPAGDRLGIGEQLTVKLARADVEAGQLELRPVRAGASAEVPRPARQTGSRPPRSRRRR